VGKGEIRLNPGWGWSKTRCKNGNHYWALNAYVTPHELKTTGTRETNQSIRRKRQKEKCLTVLADFMKSS